MSLPNACSKAKEQCRGREKGEVSFEFFKKLMKWGTAITGKRAFFFCLYLGNTWSFMCCSNNTERLCHKHFVVWHQDSAGVPFSHEKNNQAGDPRKIMKPQNLYPNPFDPRFDTILATAIRIDGCLSREFSSTPGWSLVSRQRRISERKI